MEYEEVICRPRFRRSDSEIANALRAIRETGFWVKPSQKVHKKCELAPTQTTMFFWSALRQPAPLSGDWQWATGAVP
jgi:hypothetical protein